jgi:hypothetical protein
VSILAGPVFLLSAAAVVAAMLAPVLLAPRKDFGYTVLYDGLFDVAAEIEGEDDPEKGEAEGEQVRVVAVELKNSSGLNIERSHYARPISVGFGEGARILDAEVIEEHPPGIEASLRGVPERDPERVALTPVLLNDGDVVLLEAVVADSLQGEIEVDGRIVGIRHLVDRGQRTVERTVLAVANGVPALAATSLGSLYLVVAGFIDMNFVNPSMLDPVAGGLTGLVAGDVMLLLGVYRRWRRKREVRRRVISRRVGDGASVE